MDLLSAVSKQFKTKELDTDNWVFKLSYRWSFGLCLLGSILCAATTYIGTPIICDHKDVPSESLASQFCWLHGSYHIPAIFQKEERFGCFADPENHKKDGDADRTTAYYQWVVFVLVLNGILFALPRQIWKILEGGLISEFGKEAKSTFIIADEEKMDSIVKQYVKYFNVLKHKNDRYFAEFVLCEFLNFAVLIMNFCITNIFLGKEFMTYGSDVLAHYQKDLDVRRESVNPMCNVFPTIVSCDIKYVSASKQIQKINGLCILSQNIINEKVFLVLWFWYVILMVVTSIFFIYRIATIVMPSVRVSVLTNKVGGKRNEAKKVVNRILKQLSLGDWFLLDQIAKNANPCFFREFIFRISEDLNANHKSDEKSNKGKHEEIALINMQERYNDGPNHVNAS